MRRAERLFFVIIITVMMLTAVPGTSCALEAASFDTGGNPDKAVETVETVDTVDLSVMDGENAAADELLILVEDGTSRRELSGIADDAGASLGNISDLDDGSRLASISLDDPEDTQQVADSLIADDKVLIVQPNYIYRLEEDESDDSDGSPKFYQWHLDSPENGNAGAIDACGAWELLSEDGGAACVAVIDTGAALDHPDLQGMIDPGRCVSFNDGVKGSFTQWDGKDDDDGHGTHVCGIIAAAAGIRDGGIVSGIACGRTELIVIDAAKPGGKTFTTQDVVCAINYAVENGADIINMSLGGLYHDYLLEDAINHAYHDNGVLSVCAAGNESSDLPASPGDAAGAIGVMSHDRNGARAYQSNYGTEKDVSAPGKDIRSTYVTYLKATGEASYIWKLVSGTSMAAPMVAGLAALLKAEDSSLSPRAIKNLIYTSSGEAGFGDFGFGRINAKTALKNLHDCDPGTKPESIELNRSDAEMHPGEYLDLEYAVYPAAASLSADGVTFSSSNDKVAEVDSCGRVTAVAAGTAVITADCEGRTADCAIEVSDAACSTIGALPYSASGYFELTDTRAKITGSKGEPVEVMTDTYEAGLEAGDASVAIEVGCKLAVPYVSVRGPSGNELSLSTKLTKEGGGYILRAVFRPEQSGRYLISVMGETEGSSTKQKAYTLSVSNLISLEDAVISGIGDKVYTGKALTQNVEVSCGGSQLKKDRDFTVGYENNTDAGTATVIISGAGSYEGTWKIHFRIAKAKNGMTASGKTVKVKRSKLKKKAQNVKLSKAVSVKGADGSLKVKKLSGSSRLSLDKNGNIRVKKKTQKGKYKIKLRVTAKGDSNHSSAHKDVWVSVRVK